MYLYDDKRRVYGGKFSNGFTYPRRRVCVHDMNYIVVKNRPGQNKLNKFKRTERGRSRPTRDVYAFSRRSAIIDRHLFSP